MKIYVIIRTGLGGYNSIVSAYEDEHSAKLFLPKSSDIEGYEIEEIELFKTKKGNK